MSYEDWPHGLCECDTGNRIEMPDGKFQGCCRGTGPAAFVNGERRVCSRCNVEGADAPLVATGEDPFGPLMDFDPLGAIVIANRLQADETLP